MSKNATIVSQLNQLLTKIIDAKKGYHTAAEEIDDPTLKGMFMSMAEQRENFRKSVREEIHDLGGKPSPSSIDQGYIQESFAQPELLMILNTVEQTMRLCLQDELETLTHYKNIFCEADDSTCNLIAGQQENVALSLSDLKMLGASTGMAM
jgi:uncharacterized protein (TIGR02284 family)